MNAPITETAVNPTSGADSDLPALFADSDVRAWYRRPVLWTGALLLVIAGAGGWYWQAHRAASTGPSYTTRTVVRGDLTLTVTANGTLQPTRSISIGSELSGTVRKVNVDVNDRIQQGQVFAGILSFCQFVPSLMSTVPFEVSVASTKPCQWRSRYGAGHA